MTPYAAVDHLQRRNRRRVHPWSGLTALLPVLLGLAASWSSRGTLLWFCGLSPSAFAEGLAAVSLRLGLVACGVGLLGGNDLVLRGEDRAALDPFPIDARALVPVLVRRLLRNTAGITIGLCLLLAPVGSVPAFLLGSAVVLQGWLLGVSLGGLSPLGAAWAWRSPAFAWILEGIRGDNPRQQAAIIYAPGVAVIVAGLALWLGTRGLVSLLGTLDAWALALPVPGLLALVLWPLAPVLAARTWYAATALVHEVDAAWATRRDPQEDLRVYLEWSLRFLPLRLRPYVLLRLRQGWRDLRGWVTGAWGLGGVAALAAWSSRPEAPAQAFLAGAAAVVGLAAVAIRMEDAHPQWLDEALSPPPLQTLIARGLVTFAWLQGVIVLPSAASLIRHPAGFAAMFLGLEAVALASTLLAAPLGRLRRRGYSLYAPLAVGICVLAVYLFP